MECHICFESVIEDSMLWLECSHSLCYRCCRRLINLICPFCRQSIDKKLLQKPPKPVVINWDEYGADIEEQIIQRRPRRTQRRRRYRHSPHPITNLIQENTKKELDPNVIDKLKQKKKGYKSRGWAQRRFQRRIGY